MKASSEYSLTEEEKSKKIAERGQSEENTRPRRAVCAFLSRIFCCRPLAVRKNLKEGSTVVPSREKKTLVLDLDETLVHSTFKPIENPDLALEVNIDGVDCQYFVLIRPHLDEFLKIAEELFTVVIFTASLKQYASAVIDRLDSRGTLIHRLYRDSCAFYNGAYVKDLGTLCKNLKDVCIVDNSPVAYSLQPQNGIPIKSWFGSPKDKELLKLVPLLQVLSNADNIPEELSKIKKRLVK